MTNHSPLEYFDAAADARMGEELRKSAIAARAMDCARGMIWVPGRTSQYFARRLKQLNDLLRGVFASVQSSRSTIPAVFEEQRWLQENLDLLRSELTVLQEAAEGLERTEHVRRPDRELVPRVLVVAENLLASVDYRFDDSALAEYLRAFQSIVVLRVCELWEMVPALKLVLLERIVSTFTDASPAAPPAVSTCIISLRALDQAPWNDLLEPLIVFDEVLRRDPAGAYARMDPQSRERYRQEVVHLAHHSDHSELEIAELAVSLAWQSLREPESDSRLALRRAHVGYYLLAEGRALLYRRANIRIPLRDRFRAFLRRHPDEFYPLGIEILTLGMVLAVLWSVNFSSLWAALIAGLALLIPCSQSAVEVMNCLTTLLLEPQALPKLDFSRGVPEGCTTMVVVPTLLLNEKQVRQLVNELEVRYVGNRSANLHFALLTDLPDAAEQPREDDPLVDLCGDLIRELNRKHAANGAGTFAMFHRHRVYNRGEGVWMGWERKRGKLLDFNKLVLGDYDSFPYKVGDLSILRRVRYVLTLDSDTELPRGAAQRLIGTLAHPLCQAIIDSERNVVIQGYGTLQPRVGVSVQSTAQSRLASIYSGLTGFDIYTQAVSNVYQDLYGEGTFVGKGLYEVRTVHRVLDQRFPRNAILSHDLIEGAYTRAGLVTDVELVDSYPSHYRAYVRRKHRWVRGDWQIVEWLFPRVPDEFGRRITNPISFISRWKILDNLRRSVVDPATVALFLLGWTILAGRAAYWTFAVLAILFVPTAFQLVAGLIGAAITRSFALMKQAFASFATGLASLLLTLAFLLHDALVCTDAIWRSLYRRVVSRERLLQWETAAQAEAGGKARTPVDLYLLTTPAIVLAMVAAVFFMRRPALWVALPILVLWGCSKLISLWLDRPPRIGKKPASRKDELFLRRTALRTWRFFAEFSTQEHNWLIPDNLQEEPAQLAARTSPTNLGFLLNARQVACELGYLTLPELVDQTQRTLETMKRLRSHRGHLLNWYDTRTLAPLLPAFVSTVDSGNLAASLIAVNRGCRAMLEKPLLSPALLRGYDDHLHALADLKALSSWKTRRAIRARKSLPLLQHVFAIVSDRTMSVESRARKMGAGWLAEQLGVRRESLQRVLAEYMPWLLPEFESVRGSVIGNAGTDLPLSQLTGFIRDLEIRLGNAASERNVTEHERQQRRRLLSLVSKAHLQTANLICALNQIAGDAESWFTGMDFSFLLNRRRKMLSIGYLVDTGELHTACYDLLASEARIAVFVGIAKGDLPQEVWFRLGRTHVPTGGGPTLVSWAGTMFEYLLPAIWLRSYPDTLLQRSMERAVKMHQAYVARKGVPWGMSESGYSELNEDGSYGYRFFGVPELAMQRTETQRLVIAPYGTAMALSVDPTAALKNLRRMVNRGWFGDYGFYEAADFGPSGSSARRCRVVRSWMAHHQGMTLVAVANFLCRDVVPQWLHRDVYVQATELLLQERIVVRRVRPAWHIKPPVKGSRMYAIPGSQFALESQGRT